MRNNFELNHFGLFSMLQWFLQRMMEASAMPRMGCVKETENPRRMWQFIAVLAYLDNN